MMSQNKEVSQTINKKTSIKSWDELTLADNFIFQKFMRNESICKKVLSEILDKEVVRISYPEYEKSIDVRHDAKSIRLDIYIKGEEEVYNLEMQAISRSYLPKRGRYYQELMDLDLLEKGVEYDKLCQSYVIFICTFDFYHLNQYKYTFTNRCHEVDDLEYGDMTTKIMLNTKGTNGNVSEDLKTFLAAVDGIFTDNKFSHTIKEEYDRIKKSREFRREYMTLEQELKNQYKSGIVEGERRVALKLLKSGVNTDIILSSTGLSKEELDKMKSEIE